MNRDRQRGVTLLGWMVIIAIIGIFAIAAMRIGPLYLEYFKVSSVLSSLNAEFDGKASAKRDIQQYISKRFDIEQITGVDSRDVQVTRRGDVMEVALKYDARRPFIGNLDFIVTFDKKFDIKR